MHYLLSEIDTLYSIPKNTRVFSAQSGFHTEVRGRGEREELGRI